MKLSKFKFNLDEERIAQFPVHHDQPSKDRDDAKMLVVHKKTGEIEHKQFKNIIDYFDDKDVFVFNDTKVFPARLYGKKEKTEAQIEVFLLRELNEELRLWDVLVDPARKIRIGNKLYFGDESLVAEVIDNTTSRGRTLRFLFDGPHDEFKQLLYSLGETPLPGYIKSKRDPIPEDADNYQTVFAANEGAVVAPAAAMHFSRSLLKRAEIKGIDFVNITLHAGLGNFREIDVEDLTKHKMDSEPLEITESAADRVNEAVTSGHNVCVIGTTTLRAIESSVGSYHNLKPFSGWTNKFIFPPYDFAINNSLVTNLHLPYSPMLMMTCAFSDYDLVMKAYDEAVSYKDENGEGYKFGVYGDAMLILP